MRNLNVAMKETPLQQKKHAYTIKRLHSLLYVEGFSDIVLNLLCFSLSLLAHHLRTVPMIVNFSRNIINYWLFVLLVDFRCSMWDGETLWCALTLCVRRNLQTTSNIFSKVWCCKEFSFLIIKSQFEITFLLFVSFLCSTCLHWGTYLEK